MKANKVYIFILFIALSAAFTFVAKTGLSKTVVQEDDSQTLFIKIAKETKIKGPSYVFNKIQTGFINENYDINKCHSLLHALGHSAYEYYGKDFKSYGNLDYQMCFQGFQHGVEAQIALQELDDENTLKKTLNSFCDFLKSDNPEAECFHGAGHAFFQNGFNVLSALKRCDLIEFGGHTDCYRGVFSERVNRIMGIDGDTDSKIAGFIPEKVDPNNVYKECFGYPFKYREACITQFTILIPDTGGLDNMINTCLRYIDYVEDICIFKISGNLASFTIGENKDVPLPDNFTLLSFRARKIFIEGVINQYDQYPDTPKRNEFCSRLGNVADKSYCMSLRR